MQMKKEDYEVPLMSTLNTGQAHMGTHMGGAHPQSLAGNEALAHTGQLGLDHMAMAVGRDLLGMAGHHPHHMAGHPGGQLGGGGQVSMDAKSSTRSISPPMIPCGLTDAELVSLSVRELNKQLKNKGLNKEEMGTMKQR